VSKNNRICIYCACKMTKLTILSSQGSVLTHLRCGGQCNKKFVANLLPNSKVKKCENRLIFARVMDRRTEVPFLTHSVLTVSVKCVALEILAFKTTVTLKPGSGSLKVIETDTIR